MGHRPILEPGLAEYKNPSTAVVERSGGGTGWQAIDFCRRPPSVSSTDGPAVPGGHLQRAMDFLPGAGIQFCCAAEPGRVGLLGANHTWASRAERYPLDTTRRATTPRLAPVAAARSRDVLTPSDGLPSIVPSGVIREEASCDPSPSRLGRPPGTAARSSSKRRFWCAGQTSRWVRNPDGRVTLKSLDNNKFVTAENAGINPWVASRTAIGPWEEVRPRQRLDRRARPWPQPGGPRAMTSDGRR
jgi:hypothetical protein